MEIVTVEKMKRQSVGLEVKKMHAMTVYPYANLFVCNFLKTLLKFSTTS